MARLTALIDSELEESFDRSSGPGGQNVNKTSTKVTLRHLPTGLSVTVQDTRSQWQNRALARERLLALLNSRDEERRKTARAAREAIRRRNRPRPPGVKRGILETKKRRGQVKKERSRKDFDS